MWLSYAYYLLLFTALSVMLAQVYFKPVRTEHILTAIFCGSLAMVALQVLTTASGSTAAYVFALGTCATCNVIWLIARALFRGANALSAKHYLLAASIAGLVIVNRSAELLISVEWLNSREIAWLTGSVSEITRLLSSTILALAFWEPLRGFSTAGNTAKRQRFLFASIFFVGVFSCTVITEGLLTEAARQQIRPWLVVISALAIVITTFIILLAQHKQRQNNAQPVKRPASLSEDDLLLARQIEHLMEYEKLYLNHELKTIDIANALNVSEYKVGRVIRSLSNAANVNQFINRYRIAHAKQLLTAQECQHWTILVISLECGFASLAPFNRAFKASEGCTPNQYRQQKIPQAQV
ncbi:AraC family transcriptional regulator [Alteromonas lipolytica]|nr:AraC family transcriptional regulator [Alteromonas lipolytica]